MSSPKPELKAQTKKMFHYNEGNLVFFQTAWCQKMNKLQTMIGFATDTEFEAEQ